MHFIFEIRERSWSCIAIYLETKNYQTILLNYAYPVLTRLLAMHLFLNCYKFLILIIHQLLLATYLINSLFFIFSFHSLLISIKNSTQIFCYTVFYIVEFLYWVRAYFWSCFNVVLMSCFWPAIDVDQHLLLTGPQWRQILYFEGVFFLFLRAYSQSIQFLD